MKRTKTEGAPEEKETKKFVFLPKAPSSRAFLMSYLRFLKALHPSASEPEWQGKYGFYIRVIEEGKIHISGAEPRMHLLL